MRARQATRSPGARDRDRERHFPTRSSSASRTRPEHDGERESFRRKRRYLPHFPAWPRKSTPTSLPSCRHCGRGRRESLRDPAAVSQEEPPDGPPAPPRFGIPPGRVRKGSVSFLPHTSGQDTPLLRPFPKRRISPPREVGRRTSAGAPPEFRRQKGVPRLLPPLKTNGPPELPLPSSRWRERDPRKTRLQRPSIQQHLRETLPPRQRPTSPHRSTLPPPVHSAADPSITDRRTATYAQAVTRGCNGETEREDDGWKTVRRSRNKGRPPTHLRPMDPRQDGRCFRCLARGHAAHSCREPIKCRLCRQGGHRQASCPLQMPPSTEPATTGLFACLVGELRDADPQWTHIIDGIQALCPELTDPDCHRLTAGDIFIRGLSKDAWRRIHGQTQHLDGGGSIFWQRPQPMDGAFPSRKTTHRLEARGVPFGLRTWRHLEQLIRPIGTLRKVVCNGLHAGDPNCLCMDVEMAADKDVLGKIQMAGGAGGAGASLEILLAALSPPPPIAHLPTTRLQLGRPSADDTGPAASGAAATTDKWYPPAFVSTPLLAQATIPDAIL